MRVKHMSRPYISYLRGPTEVKNFEKAKEHYKTCSTSPFPQYSEVPEWVPEKFQQGCFPSCILEDREGRRNLMPPPVQDFSKKSAWIMSRPIREYLYGFVGLQEVKEIIRKEGTAEFDETMVWSQSDPYIKY